MGVVGNGLQALGLVLLARDGVSLTGLHCLALKEDGLALGLCGLLGCGVGLDTGEELVARARVADVLDADVDALLDVAVSDLAVEDDSNGRLGHVVDDTGLAVVDLVRHTVRVVRRFSIFFCSILSCHAPFLDRSVRNNVHNITGSVDLEVGGQVDHTLRRS